MAKVIEENVWDMAEIQKHLEAGGSFLDADMDWFWWEKGRLCCGIDVNGVAFPVSLLEIVPVPVPVVEARSGAELRRWMVEHPGRIVGRVGSTEQSWYNADLCQFRATSAPIWEPYATCGPEDLGRTWLPLSGSWDD